MTATATASATDRCGAIFAEPRRGRLAEILAGAPAPLAGAPAPMARAAGAQARLREEAIRHLLQEMTGIAGSGSSGSGGGVCNDLTLLVPGMDGDDEVENLDIDCDVD